MNPKEIDFPLPSTEILVAEAERAIEKSTLKSLQELVVTAGVELPNFYKLVITRYAAEEEQLRGDSNIWYGLTRELQLYRIQHLASWGKLRVCRATSEDRLQEIVMGLALKKEKAALMSLSGELLTDKYIEIFAKGFGISHLRAEQIINNLTKQEVIEDYALKVAEPQL